MFLLILIILAIFSDGAMAASRRPLRDPTRPLATTSGQATRAPSSAAASLAHPAELLLPRLQLVLTSNDRRYAVIDGELLAEGDSFNGMRLQKIQNEAVIIATPNGPRTLPLPADTE